MCFENFKTLILLLLEYTSNFSVKKKDDGYQIVGNGWDVIITYRSFGHEDGLLEVYCAEKTDDGFGGAVGWLTAQEVISQLLNWDLL